MIKKKRKKKKIKKKIKKAKSLKVEKKRLEIPKNNLDNEKITIKKIKKQPTEKRQYNINQHVVYPKHGVGKILSIEKAVIAEIETNCYKVLIPREKLTLTVPVNQQSNLRPTSSINQINKCISILKTKPKIKRTMWSRRAQEYEQKINSGKIYELAEVVKDLNKTSNTIADQSYSERQLFEKAYDRLQNEFEVVLQISQVDVKKKMDKALGRNQNLEE
jgi:CarD family transcriptional regulator